VEAHINKKTTKGSRIPQAEKKHCARAEKELRRTARKGRNGGEKGRKMRRTGEKGRWPESCAPKEAAEKVMGEKGVYFTIGARRGKPGEPVSKKGFAHPTGQLHSHKNSLGGTTL